MRSAIWVMGSFAVAWAAGGVILGHAPFWLIGVAILISGLLIRTAMRKPEPVIPEALERRIGRTVAIWSAIEGVAMFVTANVLINLHYNDALMPAFAVIVGAHFAPLAIGLRVPSYWATAAALVAIGIAGFAAPLAVRPLLAGGGAAIILWLTCLALLMGIGARRAFA